MFKEIDNYTTNLINSPSFFKKHCISRAYGILSTAALAITATVHLIATPIILLFGTFALGFALLTSNQKKIITSLNALELCLKSIVVHIGCAILNPMVALISPILMIKMHEGASLILDKQFAVEEEIKQPPLSNKNSKPENENNVTKNKNIPIRIISEAANEINDKLCTQKTYNSELQPHQPIVLYGPKENWKKNYALQLGKSLQYDSFEFLSLDMNNPNFLETLNKHLFKIRDLSKGFIEKTKKNKTQNDFDKFLNDNNFIKTLIKNDFKKGTIYLKNYEENKKNKKLIESLQKMKFLVIISSEKKLNNPKFKIQIENAIPLEKERSEIIFNRLEQCPNKEQSLNIDEILKNTKGMTRKNVLNYLENSINQAMLDNETLSNKHFLPAKKEQKIGNQNTPLYAENKKLTKHFDKHLSVLLDQENAKSAGLEFPAGILLYGKPGCGKTFAAESLQEYAKKKGIDLPFIRITLGDVSKEAKYVGERLNATRAKFEEAKKQAPAIVFIDECDGFFSKRCYNEEQASAHQLENNREIDDLLTLLEDAKKHNLIVIAATNNYKGLDPAVIRHGRFDYHIKIKAPDTAMRRQMLLANLQNKNCSEELAIDQDFIRENVSNNIDNLVETMEGIPASDIAFIIREAALVAFMKKTPISLEIIKMEIEKYKKRLLKKEKLHKNELSFIQILPEVEYVT